MSYSTLKGGPLAEYGSGIRLADCGSGIQTLECVLMIPVVVLVVLVVRQTVLALRGSFSYSTGTDIRTGK